MGTRGDEEEVGHAACRSSKARVRRHEPREWRDQQKVLALKADLLMDGPGAPILALRAESQSNLDWGGGVSQSNLNGAVGVVGEGRRDGSLLLRGITRAYVTLSLGPSCGPAVDVQSDTPQP